LMVAYGLQLIEVWLNNEKNMELHPYNKHKYEHSLWIAHSCVTSVSFTCYILAHWIFGLKYLVVALLLRNQGTLPKGQELCKNIVNVGVICLIISGSGLYGYLRHQYDTKLYNQEDLNTIHYLIVMVAWVLFGCLLMSTFALLAGLCIIRNVLKGAEHLLVNEKYMGLHCVFFLLAVIGNGLVVCSPLDGVTYYKY
jgi:hypothetical protein